VYRHLNGGVKSSRTILPTSRAVARIDEKTNNKLHRILTKRVQRTVNVVVSFFFTEPRLV
jgi:hypothetical protein